MRASRLWLLPWMCVPNARMVRVLGGNETIWKNGECPEEQLADCAKKVFAAERTEDVSVFLASSAVQEAEIAAAFRLKGAGSSQPAPVVRIRLSLLFRHGIAAVRSHGVTGISRVDRRHWDLHANATEYIALTRSILRERLNGEDNFRSIPATLLQHQWRAFAGDTSSAISDFARRDASKKMGRNR
jgi:hypothetical protein